jgi:hypothetical protein
VLILLSSLVTALTGVAPFAIPTPILFGGTLLYTLRTSGVDRRRRILAALLVVAGAGLAIGSAAVTARTGPESEIDSGVTGLLVVITRVAVGRRLLHHPVVNVSTVAGALCIYLLLGVFFAFFFGFISQMWIGPFFASTARPRAVDFIYFSHDVVGVALNMWPDLPPARRPASPPARRPASPPSGRSAGWAAVAAPPPSAR